MKIILVLRGELEFSFFHVPFFSLFLHLLRNSTLHLDVLPHT